MQCACGDGDDGGEGHETGCETRREMGRETGRALQRGSMSRGRGSCGAGLNRKCASFNVDTMPELLAHSIICVRTTFWSMNKLIAASTCEELRVQPAREGCNASTGRTSRAPLSERTWREQLLDSAEDVRERRPGEALELARGGQAGLERVEIVLVD